MISIYIKTYSKVGEYHRSKGKENEDAYRILVNGDYVYCMVSDGAGSSAYAKEAAWCTIEAAADFCYGQGANFFDDNYHCAAKRLIFDVQQALFEKANEQNTDLSQMMCTLVLLAINTKTKQYVTVHVGDGLIAATQQQQTQILSYPENGPTKQYTYMVNSPNVMKHLRVKIGCYDAEAKFFVCSDGAVENCYSTGQYIKRIKVMNYCSAFNDDVTYCFFRPESI